MQRVGPYLPPVSSDPDVLRCVYYCGTFYQYTFDGYFYMSWVDTWTPITIPGEFDHANYSVEAYEHSKEVAVFLPYFPQVATHPAAQRAAERAIVWVIGVTGVAAAAEEIRERIENMAGSDTDTVLDPWAKEWQETVIGTAWADVDDPEECMIAIDDLIVEDGHPASFTSYNCGLG